MVYSNIKVLSFLSALKNAPPLSQLKDINVTTIQPVEYSTLYVYTMLLYIALSVPGLPLDIRIQ